MTEDNPTASSHRRAVAAAPAPAALATDAPPVPEPTALERRAIGAVRAQAVDVRQGVVGGIAAGSAELSQGLVYGVIAREVSIREAIVRTVVAAEVRFERASLVGVVIARRVQGDVRTLVDWRGAAAFGAAFGVIAAILGRRRRREPRTRE